VKNFHFVRHLLIRAAVGTILAGILVGPSIPFAEDGWKSNVWTGFEY
jgi:hypothetical protein